MAQVTTAISFTGSYQPFERPPQAISLWSAIPRGLQSFSVDTQLLDAKPINDIQLLTITATIPPNFGYVFADVALTISQDVADAWDPAFILNLQNFYRAPQTVSLGLSISAMLPSIAGGFGTVRATAEKTGAFSFPIVGVKDTTGIQINLQATNQAAPAGAIGTVNAYISFWQFDLEQIFKYPINSPIPTNAR